MLKSSPNANVGGGLLRVLPELVELVNKHDLVKLTMKKFKKKDAKEKAYGYCLYR
jgi:precorrin-2 dehydrogenase/sirohydrochlorin ferrochelatase